MRSGRISMTIFYNMGYMMWYSHRGMKEMRERILWIHREETYQMWVKQVPRPWGKVCLAVQRPVQLEQREQGSVWKERGQRGSLVGHEPREGLGDQYRTSAFTLIETGSQWRILGGVTWSILPECQQKNNFLPLRRPFVSKETKKLVKPTES